MVPYVYLYFPQPQIGMSIQSKTQKFKMSYHNIMFKGPLSCYTLI